MTAIKIDQGTDGGVRWLVNDDEGYPYDFTGWTVKAQVRARPGLPVLHEWSTALNTASADAQGHVTLTWAHAVTTAWAWQQGTFDIELTSPAGKVSRLDSGTVTVSQEVTK